MSHEDTIWNPKALKHLTLRSPIRSHIRFEFTPLNSGRTILISHIVGPESHTVYNWVSDAIDFTTKKDALLAAANPKDTLRRRLRTQYSLGYSNELQIDRKFEFLAEQLLKSSSSSFDITDQTYFEYRQALNFIGMDQALGIQIFDDVFEEMQNIYFYRPVEAERFHYLIRRYRFNTFERRKFPYEFTINSTTFFKARTA